MSPDDLITVAAPSTGSLLRGDDLAERGEVWHRADRENTALALSGAPWTTLCGIKRPPIRASRPRTGTGDTCVVCVELSGGAS